MSSRDCVACGSTYEFLAHKQYPGRSPVRCPECQVRYTALQNLGVGTEGSRPPGHKTRQQHKKVSR